MGGFIIAEVARLLKENNKNSLNTYKLNLKKEAKKTKTKKVYNLLLKDIKKENERIINENKVMLNENMGPPAIKNLFKMARMLVTHDDT